MRVIVHVNGGIAEVIHKDAGVQVEIIDYDNSQEPDDPRLCLCQGGEQGHGHETWSQATQMQEEE